MTVVLNPDKLLRARMHALRLTRTPDCDSQASPAERIAKTARHMLAVQGQDWRSSRWALGVRTVGTTAQDVYDAFNQGLIVRSWPMRGTIHIVAAEDIGWMQQALGHRVLPGAPKRRATIGLSDATLDRLVDTATQALAHGASLDRDELTTVWSDAGIECESSWRYHVIWWMCQNGLTTLGPVQGDAEPRLVLAADWIRSPIHLQGDDALAEIALRYTAARGPITVRDFAWWTGLTIKEARHALSLAGERGSLTEVRMEGETKATHWADPEQIEAALTAHSPAAAPAWHLLPAFDEHLLGYTDRAAQLAPEHAARIVPGKNGVFLATITHAGRVVGTWKREVGAGAKTGKANAAGRIAASVFPGEHIDADALAPQLEEWARFHGTASAAAATPPTLEVHP